jgi:hypothetical protein
MNTEHFAVELTEADRTWILGIIQAMCENTLNFEVVKLGMELAFKKGYYKGANGN